MQAVKRNRNRFPDDFMFGQTREEIMRISQFVASVKFSKVVYAFTEQGLAMLSGVLNSERAVIVNIAIMRAFVKLRQSVAAHKELSVMLRQLEMKMTSGASFRTGFIRVHLDASRLRRDLLGIRNLL